MSDLDVLRAKGFHITNDAADSVTLRWSNAAPATAFKVLKNPDGSLHLVTERSATHRMLATELGR